MNHSATYSPEDNKLRLYPACRLSKEDYDRVRGHGFIWAPKQELFVAPMWTPDRQDFLLEFCDLEEIGDEDKSLVERQEERAERFSDYSDSRKDDAEHAHKAVSAIADNIPLGQPILVGHHSERHARRDAEKIENGMRRAIKMWDQAQYWKDRAAGALRLARYKERPDVRYRRIKRIEADKRGSERSKAKAEGMLKMWSRPDITLEKARAMAGGSEAGYLACVDYQHEGASYVSHWSAYDVLKPDEDRYAACPSWTVAQVVARAHEVYPRTIAHYDRWIAHYDNRLAYERAMLGEQGGTAADKFALAVGGRVLVRGEWKVINRLNRSGGQLVSVSLLGYFRSIGVEEIGQYQEPTAEDSAKLKGLLTKPPMCNYPGQGLLVKRLYSSGEFEAPADCAPITQAQWDGKHADYKGSRVIEPVGQVGRHRVRYGMFGKDHQYLPVYITDAKIKNPPSVEASPASPQFAKKFSEDPNPKWTAPKKEEGSEKFEALREVAAAGVKVVISPQLFPTPPDLAKRLVELLYVEPGQDVLEPSAGTGALLVAFGTINLGRLVAVEVNLHLADNLAKSFPLAEVYRQDFLETNGDLGKFDRIVMNPPFTHGEDIKHIKHAIGLLKPGGRLVALCAAGHKQRKELEPICDEWIDLPAGSFAESGTNVNVAIVIKNI